MKYVSIDIETTGLNPKTDQILSIGLVVEDTRNILPLDDLPKLEVRICREKITGDLFAINMNKDLIEAICNSEVGEKNPNPVVSENEPWVEYWTESSAAVRIFKFLQSHGVLGTDVRSLTVAGKNFATFDKLFLENFPQWQRFFRIRSRILDPAILFVDWKSDSELPNLSKCKQRANILDHSVSHVAVEDALDVIKLLRTNY